MPTFWGVCCTSTRRHLDTSPSAPFPQNTHAHILGHHHHSSHAHRFVVGLDQAVMQKCPQHQRQHQHCVQTVTLSHMLRAKVTTALPALAVPALLGSTPPEKPRAGLPAPARPSPVLCSWTAVCVFARTIHVFMDIHAVEQTGQSAHFSRHTTLHLLLIFCVAGAGPKC